MEQLYAYDRGEIMGVLLSIIVPVYNVERFLDRCMTRLVNQTFKDIEIILVDDGAKDGSGDMCDWWGKNDHRIKVIHKQNAGLGMARNSGLSVAKGDYVAFVDSDDYVATDMYEKLMDEAISKNADYVRCNSVQEDPNGNPISYTGGINSGIYVEDEIVNSILLPMLGKDINESRRRESGVSVWRAVYRKSIIDENKIEFPSERVMISEDIPFNVRFLVRSSIAVAIDDVLYHYVVNPQSLTKIYKPDRFEREIFFNKKMCELLKEEGLFDRAQIRIKRLFLDRVKYCIKVEGYCDKNPSCKLARIEEMLNNEYLQWVLGSIPLRKMPIRYHAVSLMMKYKKAKMLLALKEKL